MSRISTKVKTCVRSVRLCPPLLQLLGDDLLRDGRRAVPPPQLGPRRRRRRRSHEEAHIAHIAIASAVVVLVAHSVFWVCRVQRSGRGRVRVVRVRLALSKLAESHEIT